MRVWGGESEKKMGGSGRGNGAWIGMKRVWCVRERVGGRGEKE